jgi:hypothetical protein
MVATSRPAEKPEGTTDFVFLNKVIPPQIRCALPGKLRLRFQFRFNFPTKARALKTPESR